MKQKKGCNDNRFDHILLQGVSTHNLKNIDVRIPKNKITTITGVSGSGKSSLAFHTLYKEGQFRYIESLSSYLRQFFNLGARPKLEYSEGLSPAIAIEQNKRVGNARSTVGTLTEIDDYLRLLMAKLGDVYCYACANPLRPQTTEQIVNDIVSKFKNKKIYLLQDGDVFENVKKLGQRVRKNRRMVDKNEGITRFLVEMRISPPIPPLLSTPRTSSLGEEGKIDYYVNQVDIERVEYFYLEDPKIPKDWFPVKVYGIFDRITLDKNAIKRLKDDVIKMLGRTEKFGVMADPQQITRYTDKYYCANCNIKYPEFGPQHFSANRQEGACERCHGLGEVLQCDFDKVLDPFSPYLQAVLPRRDSNYGQGILKKLAYKYHIDEETLWKDLPERFRTVVIEGDNELLRIPTGGGKFVSLYYRGIEDVLTSQYNKGILTVDFQAMLDVKACPECGGARLRRESLSVYIKTKVQNIQKNSDKKNFDIRFNIYDLQKLPIEKLLTLMQGFVNDTDKAKELVERITKPLIDRIKTITELGLGYIDTSRKIDSLSGGEIQRLRLAKQLGNKLTGIIYVLDEPTIGLDEGEIVKVIKSIQELRDMGNTIVVVEHNESFIKASDRILEIGPGAGDFGGTIVYAGSYKKFLKADTLTAQYLQGEKTVQVDFEHTPSRHELCIRKAHKHNLQNIDVSIRLGSFTIITGPSGAGKTTLMYHTLFTFLSEKQKWVQSRIRLAMLKEGMSRSDIIQAPIMQRKKYEHLEQIALQEFYEHIGVETITGYSMIDNVLYVDQSSIGKTPRSCPATFIGVFDDIRKIYAGTTEAKMLAFGAGHFSFNSTKGGCPECKGYGYKKVELQFLPDTYVPCTLCKGRRYKPEILDITWHGKTIAEVLDMYVMDALEFFEDIPFVTDKLSLMVEIGLGYLKMGQAAHTLSGGESQRLKLVKHLLKSYKGHTIYFLDEPTVGLHPADIENLLRVLKQFLDKGDTILMIEHDKSLLQFADKVIRLENGKIVKKVK